MFTVRCSIRLDSYAFGAILHDDVESGSKDVLFYHVQIIAVADIYLWIERKIDRAVFGFC